MSDIALTSFLRPEAVVLSLRTPDKPHLLADLSRRAAAATRLPHETVLAALAGREQLGSTGLGNGIALPHARLPDLDDFFGLFARLARPIEFDAIDAKPVDLVFLLLMPAAAPNHLAALAAISRRLRTQADRDRLRRTRDPAAAYAILAEP